MAGRMKLHMVSDLTTGDVFIQGIKRRYTPAEYDAAKRDAERGDEAAIAALDDIRAGGAVDEQHWADNCPDCQAERARGQQPFVIKPKRWPSRPRWRTMRRAARGTR
jgi:hypothetical protein